MPFILSKKKKGLVSQDERAAWPSDDCFVSVAEIGEDEQE